MNTMINSLFPVQDFAIALMHDDRSEMSLSSVRVVRFTGQGEIDRTISQWLGYEPSAEEVVEIIRRVVANQIRFYGPATAQQPRKGYKGWIWSAALQAYRLYLPVTEPLYQELLLSALIHWGTFQHDPQFGLVPAEQRKDRAGNFGMQDVADYFLSVGIPETKLRRAWAAMLRLRADQGLKVGYVTCHWQGVTINGRDLSIEAQPTAHRLLLSLFDPKLHAEGKPTEMHRSFFDILDFVIGQCNPAWLLGETPAFEEFLLHYLRRGFIGLPKHMTECYGKHFDLSFDDHTESLRLLYGKAAKQARDSYAYGLAYALDKFTTNFEDTVALAKAELWSQRTTLNDEFKIID